MSDEHTTIQIGRSICAGNVVRLVVAMMKVSLVPCTVALPHAHPLLSSAKEERSSTASLHTAYFQPTTFNYLLHLGTISLP
jgi:hypothetical protein